MYTAVHEGATMGTVIQAGLRLDRAPHRINREEFDRIVKRLHAKIQCGTVLAAMSAEDMKKEICRIVGAY